MEQPTQITPYNYKDKFTSFSVVKMHGASLPFNTYDEAFEYLQHIRGHNSDCDEFWLEGHSDELGTEMIHHIYLREILTYSYKNRAK